MRILGLTGSIGMGKSTAAAMFRRDGIAVHDADAVVHDLLRRGGAAVPAVEAAFPGVVRDGAVDRRALGAQVFGDPAALRRLEAILHPLVRRRLRRFLRQAGRRGDALVVLDIPLLFETGGERFCDGVAVVSAPRLLQRQRVLARPGMTTEKFAAILAAQMPDRDKQRRADWVVPTGLGRRASRLALRAVRRQALARPGRRWRPSMALDQRGNMV
ncbi:dephospho-CoA kinase [Inquilinus ginsengisoli]|uniref:Dephospho-CoA kinase n=1 Tax=Inquilinus ginsengisoli TaxID=363840 RepID=A0ABU1JYI0_9PROT|nr:dephospho-CoA kinase [Inquilinus ginsengisoli]MDR6293688.1 dephospho-CoA kinase [Inquilinus ginsengisoli]